MNRLNLSTTPFGNRPIWRDNHDPRNYIGQHVIADSRRTKQVEATRIGTRLNFLRMI